MASKGVFKSLFKGKVKTVDNGESKVTPLQNTSIKPSRFKEAYDLWRNGNPREALLLLKTISLNDVSSLILLGEIYLELKELDLAEKAFKRSISKGQTAFAYSRLGEILEVNELYNDAIKLYKKALKCKDVEKGYVYHKLGNLYMYTGLEEKSEKTFEIAQKYNVEGGSSKLSFDYTLKSKGSNVALSTGTFVLISLFLLIGIGAFAFINFISVDSNMTSSTYEEVVEIEDVSLVTTDSDLQIQVDILKQQLGNTNSNIGYGGHIVASGDFVYSFEEDTIVKSNELNGQEEDIVFASNVFNFNIIKDRLYFIEYNDENSRLVSYNLLNGDSSYYSAEYPWNLLVDEANMYYIEDGQTQILTVQSYLDGDILTIDIDNVWLINQSDRDLFFLKDNMIYSIKKDMLSNAMDLFAQATILNDSYILDMTVEGSFIFFVLKADDTIYRMNLDGTSVQSILSGYDYNMMTLNVNKSEVFVGVDEGETIYTDVYSIDGEYVYRVDDVIGNQVSNGFLYWYPAE